ncbi:MAG: UDP-N-acetylmuramoyl-L-alanine--D-glutamate ligase [Bacteroidetes bacterium]|nr:UDP-N-acetylmuramoyl-L-alanine--D-glutamate ligase [Bacteroidota bacterium]
MTKKLAILGAGESGTGTAILGKARGWQVFVSDMGQIKPAYQEELDAHAIRWEQGMHSTDEILSADEIVKSPGIPDTAPLVVAAREKGIPVISEIEFAGRYTQAKMICISGTNGKTTTTLLTYHILKNAGLNVGLGGNIGKSFARQVAQNNYDYYVLEVSSFQLDGNIHFHSHISVLTNITPDHLDRYDYKLENYAHSKFRLALNQTKADYFIYCADDPITMEYLPESNVQAKLIPFGLHGPRESGSWVENETLCIKTEKQNTTIPMRNLSLRGIHNTYNSMAAGIVANVLEVRKDIIRESLSNFENVEHRLEFVAKFNGVEFINDSKATNVNSAWYALESMEKPVIWIAGGVDKGNNYSELKALVRDKVKIIVCLGIDNMKIHQSFQGDVDMIVNTLSAKEAVHVASRLAASGDVVLLSPACASFDLFDNYEDRGRQFKEAVRNL